jgi:hypothetical protein
LAPGQAVRPWAYTDSATVQVTTSSSSGRADAAAILYDTIVRYLRLGLRGAGAGPDGRRRGVPDLAVDHRRADPPAPDRSDRPATRRAEEAGLRTGPVGTWVYANKQLLRIGAVTLAALALVFWGQPTGTVILLMPDQQPQPRPARLLGELEHGDVAVGVPSGQDRPPPDPTPDPHRLGGTVVQDVDLRPAHDPAATFARLIRQ